MQSDQQPNGNDLPENRKAAVAAGLEQFNAIAHERDELQKENRELRTQLAGMKVAMEAMDSNNLNTESNLNTAKLERDQAVADRSVYETLFISIQAQLRAFAVPNVPLVKDRSEENNDALAAMQDSIPDSAYGYGIERKRHPRRPELYEPKGSA